MITKNDVERLLLVMPGMEDVVKYTGSPKRKTVLILSSLLDLALSTKGEGSEIFSNLPEESVKEVREFMDEMLEKSQLTSFKAQLMQLSSKK